MPARENIVNYILAQGRDYWPKGSGPIRKLPVPAVRLEAENETPPPRMILIELPYFASAAGVDGRLLVPEDALSPETGQDWRGVDWFFAAFWYLSGLAERRFEQHRGPIHSYSGRLKNWEPKIWQRAWVNRIFLFLRTWAACLSGRDERELFGPLPRARFFMTHDVDAVDKTAAIRFKQSAFHLFNSGRYMFKGRPVKAAHGLFRSAAFLFSGADYWRFPQLLMLEKIAGIKSTFHFFAGNGQCETRGLMDPSYDVTDTRFGSLFSWLSDNGWGVGLHPGYDAWADSQIIGEQKERLERAAGVRVTACRQHWLRFSWDKTWAAQEQAGIELDTTLAFNDRPGFRIGAALDFHPWAPENGGPRRIIARPTVFMDSHFYDYRPMTEMERRAALDYWIGEIESVGGRASLLWHQRVLSPDYGWGSGYQYVIARINGNTELEHDGVLPEPAILPSKTWRPEEIGSAGEGRPAPIPASTMVRSNP